MVSAEYLEVQVIYAMPEDAIIMPVQIQRGSTVRMAIEKSRILEKIPEINLENNKIGIFSKTTDLETVLTDGDRIEIYRPLKADPKEARRSRAKKNPD